MKTIKKWTPFILSLVFCLLLILFIISPFITIRDSFKEEYFNPNKTTILIDHIWADNTNILLERQEGVLEYFDKPKYEASEHLKVELTGNNPFKYVCQPIVEKQPDSFFIISGHFDDSTDTSFHVDEWYGHDPDTLLGQTILFKNGSLSQHLYFISVISLPLFIGLSIFIFIRTGKKTSKTAK